MKDEVKKIINCRVDQGKRYFEVVWKSSWEEEGFIRSIADELVEEFLQCCNDVGTGNELSRQIHHDDQIADEPCDELIENDQDVYGSESTHELPSSPNANSNTDSLYNGNSPRTKKSRKGGINSIISRLQKNQQEGLLKHFDDNQSEKQNHEKDNSNYPPSGSSAGNDRPHSTFVSTENGRPPISEMLGHPRNWNERDSERREHEHREISPYRMEQQRRESQFGTKTTQSNDYLAHLPQSPREAPRDAREGSLPTHSAFYKPTHSAGHDRESPGRYIPTSPNQQQPPSSSSLQNLKSNVENITKLFSASNERLSPEKALMEGLPPPPHQISVQPSGNVFKCTICSDVFYEESKFKQHMFMHEQVNILKQEAPKLLKPGTFECKFCHLIFNDKDKLKLHYSEEHEKEFVYTQPIDQLYQCTLCDQSFVDYNKLLHHHQTHQQSRREVFILPKKPPISGAPSTTGSPYIPGTPHVLPESQSSGTLALVHHHAAPQTPEKMRTHDNNSPAENRRPVGSPTPENQEKFAPGGKNHYDEMYEDETEHVEPVSDEMLLEASVKKEEHFMATEYGDKKMYRCNLCDEMFETEDDRAKHSLVHVNRSSSLDCHICGKQFRHRTNLSTHLIVHSGVKPHQCHICLRRFTQKVNLQRHMHIHDGSRPFTCRMCSKSFTQKANLQRHILSHTEHTKEELLVALNEIPNESEVNNAINESLTEAMSIVMEQKQPPVDREIKSEFHCDICDKMFAQKVNLQKHMLIHSGTRPFQCYVCGKAFRQRASLQKHYSVHTNGSSSFICQTCNRLFVSRTNLQRHMLVHALPGKNQCYLCDQKFSTSDNLERHFSEHIEEATPNIALPQKYFEQSTPGQTFRCATCEIVFDSPIVFSQHLQCHQKVFPPDTTPNDLPDVSKPYDGNQQIVMRCNVCGAMCMSMEKFEAHMAMHAEEQQTSSDKFVMMSSQSASPSHIESQVYARSPPSSMHGPQPTTLLVPVSSPPPMEIAKQVGATTPTTNGSHTPRVSRCPVCKEMFPSKAEMREHYSVAHLETPSPDSAARQMADTPPEPVPVAVSREQQQTPPLTGHDDDNPDDEVEQESSMQAGVISESEERLIKENEEFIKDNILGGPAEYESKGRYERGNYSCKICNRVLTYKYSLEKHMLLHTGSFPYKCHLCSKRFNHKANYDKHLIVHRGEKPYSCHICARPFSQKSNLQRHQLTHTQNRDFICDVCGKRFNHMASLKTHSLIHTGAKPFSCYICTKRFNQKGNLKRHIQTHRTGKRNKISGLGESDADIDNLLKTEIETMVKTERMENRIKTENPKKDAYDYMEKESASMVMQDDSKFYLMAAKVEHELSQMENRDGYYKTKEIKMEEAPTPSRRSQRPRQKKHMDDFEFLDDDEPLPTMIPGEDFQNTINAGPTKQPSQPRGDSVGSYPMGYEGGEQILTVLPSDAMYGDDVETKPFAEPHSERKETFHCGQCSKLFISLASLEAHKRHAHSFIMCDICGRPFSQKANLLKHKLIHANKKPFSCRVCSKAFRQKANLQRHELIHDKDRKTVNCTECNKSFRCAWSLKQHMKNHNAGGAYGCSICGKTFKGKERLMQHFSIHNQLGVFTCHLCDMKFPSPEHLLKHLETHGTFPVPGEDGGAVAQMSTEPREPSMSGVFTNTTECHLCDMKFPTPEQLLKHLETHGTFPVSGGEDVGALVQMSNDPRESSMSGDNLVIVTNTTEDDSMMNDDETIPVVVQSKNILGVDNPSVAILNSDMMNGTETPLPPVMTSILNTLPTPTS